MAAGLKISEIVKRARVNRWTCNYVLKHPDALAGMPGAGSQGVHRLFSPYQAFRLAFAAHLVTNGIPLKMVEDVIQYCDETVRSARKIHEYDHPPFRAVPSKAWDLAVYDGIYIALSQDSGRRIPHFDDGWYSIEVDRIVDTIPTPLRYFVIRLSHLQGLLEGDRRYAIPLSYDSTA